MPGRKSVPKLLNLSESFASKIVLEFLRCHSTLTCRNCATTLSCEDCQDLVTVKESLSGLLASIKNSIYNRVSYVANFTSNQFDCLYFQTFLLEDNELPISYESNGGQKDLKFFTRFATNVEKFTCKLSQVNSVILMKNLSVATNLQSVEFDNLTETILEIIGNCCSQLKSIKGKFISSNETYNSAFRKLVFEDPEMQMQKNCCCDTLECFDVKVDFNSAELFAEQIGILLHNVPNLKKIGNQINLECVIKALKPENQAPLKLQTIWCHKNLTLEMVETVKTYLTELKEFVIFSEQPINILQSLRTISSVTSVAVTIATTSDLYGGLLTSEWHNLSCLFLHGEMGVVNLSMLARKLLSLDTLGIMKSLGVTWDKKTYFYALKTVMIQALQGSKVETGFSGILSFSKTVCWLSIDIPSNENEHIVPELMDEVFPELKFLEVSPSLGYHTESVKAILEKCPELKSFSCLFGGRAGDEYRSIATYLKENNIDCIVE